MKLKSQKKRAMTIIEILISIALIAILLVPIANVVISSSNTSKKAEAKQQGALLGQNILEEIKAIDKTNGGGNIHTLLNGEDIYFNSTTKDEEIKKFDFSEPEKKNYSVTVITERVDEYSYDRTVVADANGKTGTSWDAGENTDYAHMIRLEEETDLSGIKKIKMTNPSKAELGTYLDQTNLILEVENGMKSVFYENTGSKDKPVKGKMFCEINSLNGAKNKILININDKFEKDIAIAIINKSDKDLEFEVTTEDYKYNNVNIYAGGEKTANNIKVKNYAAKSSGTQLGDLYKITVEVRYGKGSESDVVFTASTTNNIDVK